MADEEVARRYLGLYWPWEWSEDGEILGVRRHDVEKGQGAGRAELTPFAFTPELAALLERRAPRGAPSLGALIVAWAACRSNWPDCRDALLRCLDTAGARPARDTEPVDPLAVLDRVHALAAPRLPASPPEARLGALAGYAQMLLEKAPEAISPGQRAIAARQLAGKPGADWLRGDDLVADTFAEVAIVGPDSFVATICKDFCADWRLLRRCLADFHPNALEQALRTGLDRDLRPAELELPPDPDPADGFKARALIGELAEHDEVGGVARVARRLLAAIGLPRPLAASDDLPLGGVSDITNRGPLDRLLLSELAHDDLTLTARLAHNEALYLRRETPPRGPPLNRRVLLDGGVRLWGAPRVFAAAVGWALAAGADKKLTVKAFRARQHALEAVDFTSLAGVRAHLAALTSDAHVGEALPALAALAAGDAGSSDVVVVTSAAALADDEFRQRLRAANLAGAWLATVRANGQYELWRVGTRDLTRVRAAKLDLEELLAPPAASRGAPPLVAPDHRDLPAFCRLPRVPLRLPHAVKLSQCWNVPGRGVLAALPDRRLTWRPDPKHGPLVIDDALPAGRPLWRRTGPPDEPHVAVLGGLGLPTRKNYFHALHVDFRGPTARAHAFDTREVNEPIRHVTGDRDHVYLLSKHRVWAFDLWGRLVDQRQARTYGEMLHPGFYYNQPDQTWRWPCLETRRLSAAIVPGQRAPYNCLAMWRCGESAFAFDAVGRLFNMTTGETRALAAGKPACLRAVSGDGQRFVYGVILGYTNHLVYTLSGRQESLSRCAAPEWSIEPQLLAARAANFSPRKKFEGVFVDEKGLGLKSCRGGVWRLTRVGGRLVLELASTAPAENLALFGSPWKPPGKHYLLRNAALPRGGLAWLDSRGLLHLRGPGAAMPELSLALCDGAAAGWLSDGSVFGHAFLTGRSEDAPVNAAALRVLASFGASRA